MQKRVLIIDTTLGENFQYSLQNEGCEVIWSQPQIYSSEVSEEPYYLGLGLNKKVYHKDGKIVKVGQNWIKYLNDVDFIVFTDVGMSEDQQYLREKGYKVICGGFQEDMEIRRSMLKNFYKEIGQDVLPEYWVFKNQREAQEFVQKEKIGVVFKSDTQLQHNEKYSTRILKNWEVQYEFLIGSDQENIILEKYIDGWEIALGGFFDGNEFLSPILYNVEDKTLLPYEFQPLTGEMGTLVFYYKKDTPFFRKILEPLETYLKETNYVGYFDINCIYSPKEDKIYVLEATQRFGYPLSLIQQNLHKMGYYEIFKMLYGLREKEPFQFEGLPLFKTEEEKKTKEEQNKEFYQKLLQTLNNKSIIAVGVCQNQEGYPYQCVLEKSQHQIIFGIDKYFDTKVKSIIERNGFLGGLPLINENSSVNPFGVYIDDNGKFRTNPHTGRLFVFTGLSYNGIIQEQLLNQLLQHEKSNIYIMGEFIRDDIQLWKTENYGYNFEVIIKNLFLNS